MDEVLVDLDAVDSVVLDAVDLGVEAMAATGDSEITINKHRVLYKKQILVIFIWTTVIIS